MADAKDAQLDEARSLAQRLSAQSVDAAAVVLRDRAAKLRAKASDLEAEAGQLEAASVKLKA